MNKFTIVHCLSVVRKYGRNMQIQNVIVPIATELQKKLPEINYGRSAVNMMACGRIEIAFLVQVVGAKVMRRLPQKNICH